jgi:hypothetical protein
MMDFWSENPVLRGAVYALGVVALVGFFVWLSRPSAPRATRRHPPLWRHRRPPCRRIAARLRARASI